MKRLGLALVAPALLIGLWQLAHLAGWPSPRAVPAPWDVARLGGSELAGPELWRDIGATLARVGAGLGIATLLGSAVGLLLGASRAAWRAAEPTLDFVRSIPPILTFPLCLLGFGYGDDARVAAVVFGTTGIIVLHVASALARAPRARRETLRLCGAGRLAELRELHFWEALPGLVTGLRVALAAALVIAVVTEMLVGAPHGLGVRARDAQIGYRADQLWLVIVVAGAIGWALSSALAAVERRLRWE